ncbi:ribonuclease domain-containing protein [Pseudomonas germanica]|uniref:ribonuclease domain-containing protein n=1 Tax=Pseudomonas germanica TaxID=2815720 RepID=UPI00387F3C6B
MNRRVFHLSNTKFRTLTETRYYTEYVHPTPGIAGPGPQRIVVGKGGEMYYTADHYKTFIPIKIEAYRKDKWGQTTFRR